MAKKRKKSKRTKTTQEWEAMTTDDVMREIFGAEGQEALKQQVADDDNASDSNALPPNG